MVFGSPNASLLTGKLVLNQGFPSRSGDLVHFGRGTREGYRVRVEGRDFACLLAHSRIKETGCRRQTRPESIGLSSPSVALHHLEKLRGLGLLEKDSTGEYHLIEQVKVGVLQNFVGVLGFMLPRYLFYSTMFTVMLALYPIIYRPDFSTHNIMAFVFGISAVTVGWGGTLRGGGGAGFL